MASVNLDMGAFGKMTLEAIEQGLERVGIVASGKVAEEAPSGRTGQLIGSIFHRVDMSEQKVAIIVNTEYAAIQEFGGEITPAQKQALTVPVHPDAYGKTASDFPDLVMIQRPGKTPLLVRIISRRGKEVRFDIMFVLSKKVTIPAQPYLTPAIMQNLDKLTEVFVGKV